MAGERREGQREGDRGTEGVSEEGTKEQREQRGAWRGVG